MQRVRAMKEADDRDAVDARKALTLRLYPDQALRAKCQPVSFCNSWLSDVVNEMYLVMREASGIGLAAPQVGILERLFIYDLNGQSGCVVNPVIRGLEGEGALVEGCLSLPGLEIEVSRSQFVEVQGYDLRGNRLRLLADGLMSHLILHEMDHLDGVLIIDRGKPVAR
jgi:peptide deformylase